ncbi:MAG: hypothetical protein HC769_12110 [Cyanobacteria bacterium CRU_2_1]|nr:hypothetical protein [Cyanobacteria bacterium CRU_2_1]
MKLLCLSNGHGEDIIALRILQELQQHPAQPKLAALPIVGEGLAYTQHGIPIVGSVKQMPSGGFIYMDGRQFVRDLQGGLLGLTLAQLQTVRAWANAGGMILAVGDIVPLLFAWWSGAAYAFVGTAKSEYYLRDEQGLLSRNHWFERLERWSGSVYLPWERWLMSRKDCKAVFPRDRLTTAILKKWAIPSFDMGNPMMDGLEPAGIDFWSEAGFASARPLTFVLLPGSRIPEAYENWQLMVRAVASLMATFEDQRLLFLAAIAPRLDLSPFQQTLAAGGWHQPSSFSGLKFTRSRATLILTQSAFNDCLHQADLGIAMSGTATEQLVGLGKPAIIFPGKGPQFTPAFAEAQNRLLGSSVILTSHPVEVGRIVQSLWQDHDRLQCIAENGRVRMGESGASRRIADCLMERLAN